MKWSAAGKASALLLAAVLCLLAPAWAQQLAGSQYNTAAPSPSNAQVTANQADQAGNLLQFPGAQFKTGAAWTSATSLNTLQYPSGTATIGAPSGATAVLLQFDMTTTLTGGAVTFQGTYDGTNYVTVPATQVLNPQTFAQLANPYTFVASTNTPFLILPQGFSSIRANLTTVITGTGSVTPYWATLGISPQVHINPTPPSTILAGQQAVTATAAALASNTVTRGICVEALSTNTISVFAGPSGVSTTTGIEIPPGAAYCPAVSNSNAVYVIASATGASVTWSGN